MDEARFEKRFQFWKGMWGGIAGTWIACAVLLAIATDLYGNFFARQHPILGQLQTINLAISSIDRRATAQLHLHGFGERAQIVSWFFAVNLVFFAVFLTATFSGMAYVYSQRSLRTAPQRNMSLDDSRTSKLLTGSIAFTAIAVIFHIMFSNLFDLRWGGHGHSFWWTLESSNLPLIYFSVIESFVSSCLFVAYLTRVLVRWVVQSGALTLVEGALDSDILRAVHEARGASAVRW